MKKYLPLIISIALAACDTSPRPTLEERLAGKSPEERREILRVACLNEAEHFTHPSGKVIRTVHGVKSDHETEQTRNLKVVCREMAGEHSDSTQQKE
jgi:hypothetical protein